MDGTVNADSGMHQTNFIVLNDQGGSVMDVSGNVAMTLRAEPHQHEPIVCFENGHGQDGRVGAFMAGQGAMARSIAYSEQVSPTLKSVLSGGNTVPTVVYSIEGNTVDRASGKNGKGWCEDVSPTLNTQDRHAVVYALEGNGSRPSHLGNGYSDNGKMYTLNTIEQHSVCYSVDCRNICLNEDKSGTLQAKNVGGFSYNYLNPVMYEEKKRG